MLSGFQMQHSLREAGTQTHMLHVISRKPSPESSVAYWPHGHHCGLYLSVGRVGKQAGQLEGIPQLLAKQGSPQNPGNFTAKTEVLLLISR